MIQPEFWWAVGSFAYNTFHVSVRFVYAWSRCGGLNEKTFYVGLLGAKLILASLGMQKRVHPSYPLTQPEIWSVVGSFAANVFHVRYVLVHTWSRCGGVNKKTIYISLLGMLK